MAKRKPSRMIADAAIITAMVHVAKAAACEVKPATSRRMIETDATLTDAVTRKMIADNVAMDCMNRKKKTETIVGAMKGATTSRRTRGNPAPRQAAVSCSKAGS